MKNKAEIYRDAANSLGAVCRAHDVALSDTGLLEEIKDVIDRLEQEAFSAERDSS